MENDRYNPDVSPVTEQEPSGIEQDETEDEYALIRNLLNLLESQDRKYDIPKIKSAFLYAKELHRDQYRISGDPYITHPVAVAEICANLGLDTESLCAAFLHDTVEDCNDKTNIYDIKNKFGDEVAMLVDGLTKIVKLEVEDKEEEHMENLRKMLLAMAKDVRVIFIKLCDRLHNMRTLNAKPEGKQRVTALETMHVYAPLAHRLGMQRIKQELENLALSYLDPIGYEEVRSDIERKYGSNQGFIENAKEYISEKLKENGINFTLEGRVKSVYSIYKKMYNQNKSFDEIYDFYALRVIVDTELECYSALGVIHEIYNSMPGRFKDYISTPKPNMYRSLHTTVIGRDGIPFEVQIRTKEMHHIAEYGVAAHWKYKTGEKSKIEIDEKLSWIAKLIETEDDTRDPEEFIQALKIDIFQDEIFVFTPKGDVISLPQGATIIDFAYSIHTEIGHRMTGAKVNGMIAPIDRKLQNGEIVQIITSSTAKGPSRDWLKIVKTSEARNKIRQWFKKEKRPENIIVGKAELEHELKRFGRPYTESQLADITSGLALRLSISSPDDLYNAIGYGGISVSKISAKLREEFDKVVKPAEPVPEITEDNVVLHERKPGGSGANIIVDGESGCLVRLSKCCNPLPGDEIIGFITKGYGISIHKADCPNVINSMKNSDSADRWLEAHWEDSELQASGQGFSYEAVLQIRSENRDLLIADVSTALAEIKVPLLQINTVKRSPDLVILNITISCKNIEHCKNVAARLKNIKGIIDISRGRVS
ncbi:MAG: bifunctional (p)ppGpp synthetase/guanosine-3',5'-bis(diphosphate) 3'-pyrophosphohydrolase [Clostridia bacterium]|nr:bifunctional (p)ppGpp synthetase/guanosine-3',5'-bis(diphosphate) 3'-pyrophosphohydrolase [Clostridia bacterium]